jgi:ABC-type nitrate/sulfonate/bicarbonate transport system substrate-binding protein
MPSIHCRSRFSTAVTWIVGLVHLILCANAFAEEYYDKYDVASDAKQIVLGVQPMAYPLAFISSTMQRDRLLRKDLKRLGISIRALSFRKGNDMVALMGREKIVFGFLGDMPTVNTVVRSPTYIAGLGKRNFSSVVSRNYSRIEELKGKRVAYSPGSSSHLVLMLGLKAAQLSEGEVNLVKMEPSQMSDALESGNIDAYSAWEPTPSISLERNPLNRAIYRGMSTDWVVMSRDFAKAQPQVALMLMSSYVRAINWMRSSNENVERAAKWVLADGEAFTGKPSMLSVPKVIKIVRNDLLDVPGAPSFPPRFSGVPPLVREFRFLQQQGLISAGISEDEIVEAFSYNGLKQVQADPRKFHLFAFEYD